MTSGNAIVVVDCPPGKRSALETILEESFEDWYLRHSIKTLHEIETVRAVMVSGLPVGLAMLKKLNAKTGYVFYLAVSRGHRRKGFARLMLDDAIEYFRKSGVTDLYASVERGNKPSMKLFASRGFARTDFGEVSRRHGVLNAMIMYKEMLVVPGEVLLHRRLE